ncbi:hypothetical protein G4B88_006708 [Cannabis sativa]|uniref:Uncharacterized protein n=1 Tax=Cannabis sativa TaxID=3483 RepID=A0A7J6GU23_CANSA|nr:hypothetical protein G4B88_006708 [Cannabis sativa]
MVMDPIPANVNPRATRITTHLTGVILGVQEARTTCQAYAGETRPSTDQPYWSVKLTPQIMISLIKWGRALLKEVREKVQAQLGRVEEETKRLATIREIDLFIEEIVITDAHVTFYKFNIKSNQWIWFVSVANRVLFCFLIVFDVDGGSW